MCQKLLICIFMGLLVMGCNKEIDPALLDAIDGIDGGSGGTGGSNGNTLEEGIIEYGYFYNGVDIAKYFDKINYRSDDFITDFRAVVDVDPTQKQFWDQMYAMRANDNPLVIATVSASRKIVMKVKGSKMKSEFVGFGYIGENLIDLNADTAIRNFQISLVKDRFVDFEGELYWYGLKEDYNSSLLQSGTQSAALYNKIVTGNTIDVLGYTCKETVFELKKELEYIVEQPGALIPTKLKMYTSDKLPKFLSHFMNSGTSDDNPFIKMEAYYNLNNSPSFTVVATKIESKKIADSEFNIQQKYPLKHTSNSTVMRDMQWHSWQTMIMAELF